MHSRKNRNHQFIKNHRNIHKNSYVSGEVFKTSEERIDAVRKKVNMNPESAARHVVTNIYALYNIDQLDYLVLNIVKDKVIGNQMLKSVLADTIIRNNIDNKKINITVFNQELYDKQNVYQEDKRESVTCRLKETQNIYYTPFEGSKCFFKHDIHNIDQYNQKRFVLCKLIKDSMQVLQGPCNQVLNVRDFIQQTNLTNESLQLLLKDELRGDFDEVTVESLKGIRNIENQVISEYYTEICIEKCLNYFPEFDIYHEI